MNDNAERLAEAKRTADRLVETLEILCSANTTLLQMQVRNVLNTAFAVQSEISSLVDDIAIPREGDVE